MPRFLRSADASKIRINGLAIIRKAKSRISKTVFLVIVGLSAFFILMLVSIVSDQHPPTLPTPLLLRDSELHTWGVNQSTFIDDYLDLNDPTSFLTQPEGAESYCGSDEQILIIVSSATANFEQRRAIRDTWASRANLRNKNVRVLFILGVTNSAAIMEEIRREAYNHKDIIQENFIDAYHNLTLKSVSMLKWVGLTCGLTLNDTSLAPKYVFKTDDDIFVNIDRLLVISKTTKTAKMIGRLTCGARPIADPNSKLYMPKYLYPENVYPGYLSGTAYMIKGDLVPALLSKMSTTPLVHLEDIYVTALLPRKLHIYPEDSSFFTYAKISPKDACNLKFMVSSHQMKPNEMRYAYARLQQPVQCTVKKIKHVRKIPRMTPRLRKLCLFD